MRFRVLPEGPGGWRSFRVSANAARRYFGIMLIWWVRLSTGLGCGSRAQEKGEAEMSWNGSDLKNGTGEAKPPVPKAKSPSAWRGAVAGLAVVAIAGIGLWYAMSGEKKGPEKADVDKDRKIKEVTPAAASTNAAPAVAEKPKKVFKTYIDERGIERYEGGLRVVKHWPKPPQDQMNTNPHLFENRAEFEILGLVTTEPGTFILDIDYDRRTIMPAFVESLKHKIEILPDDSPEVKEQKLAVIEAKKTLEEAHKRGEDVVQIMNESRKELVKLNRYREQLLETASEKLSQDGTTDKDLNDWVDAMNKMLNDNGIRPIKQKELARDILRYQRREAARKAAEEKAKAEAAAKAAESGTKN